MTFQSITDACSDEVAGVEALLHRDSPEHGLVSPGRFVPMLEETGLMVPVGNWMRSETCLGDSVRPSANLSGRQCRHTYCTADVERFNEEPGAALHHIELVVAKGILIETAPTADETLDAREGMSTRLAVDDLGTSYSSLFLVNLPAPLSIDRPEDRQILHCRDRRQHRSPGHRPHGDQPGTRPGVGSRGRGDRE